nr:hypothetical protein [Tanacetum cinerariifolium]
MAYTYYCQLKVNVVRHKLTTAVDINFWATATAKNINREAHIHAKVDGKKVIISEATIRRDLKFEDEGRVDCSLNEVILNNFHSWDEAIYEEMYDNVERAATTATGLDAEHDRGIISKTQFTTIINEPSSTGTSLGSGPRRQETMRDAAAQTRRVKRLEKKNKSRTHRLKRLYKVGLSVRVETSAEEQSLNEEDVSKQGRNIADIDVDVETTLVDETVEDQERYKDQEMFDIGVLDDEEVVVENAVVKEVDAAQDQESESKVVKDRAEGSEIRAEESSKRVREDLQQESTKKQKVDDDQEEGKLKRCLEIVPDDEDDVTIDATPLSSKSLTIIDYKIHKERRKSYFQIIRADGSCQMCYTLSKMLKNFNQEDLEVLWSIVKARFEKVQLVDDLDYYLLHTLKTMLEHHVEDSVWKNQQGLAK